MVTPAAPSAAAHGGSWLDSPYRLLIRTSLALGVAAGFSLGLHLLLGFAFGWPLSAGTPAQIQVHGQIHVFGFLVMFVMTVGVQLFPRFLGVTTTPTELSAARHVLVQGFLLPLIVPMAARILPGYSGHYAASSAPAWRRWSGRC